MNPYETTTTRPATVTTAVAVQYALIVLGAVSAIFAAVFGDTINDAVKAELERSEASQVQIDAMANIGGSGALGIIVAAVSTALFLVLTVLVAKGKQVARVLTWVFSGLSAVLSAFGVLGVLVFSGANETIANATAAGYDAVGGWYGAWVTLYTIIGLVGSLAVIVLLALPASHPFFRKAQPEVVLPPEANMS